MTLTDYLLLLFGGLSFAVLVCLIFLKQKNKFNKFENQKIYNLGRFCLSILSFCLIVLSGNQLFQTSNPLILLFCSFLAITSLQIFWWNLIYNAQEDPFSSFFLKKGQRLDLRGTNLREADLSNADLSDANLRGADLRGANLIGANLRGANLNGANLSGADLRRANLSGACLREAYLRWAYLGGANLNEADLSRADLSRADLSKAKLSEALALLRGAEMDWPNVRGANFTNAKGISSEQRKDLTARGAIFDQFP